MPIEPPPTPWALSRPPDNHPHDAWAFGADLEPGTVIGAYRLGMFPMRIDGDLVWWSPPQRAVISVTGFTPSRSLRRAARGYEIKLDTSFDDVIHACADPGRPHGWIDESFISAYSEVHRLGWAHSVEAWDAEGLAGGLYGIGIGGLFAAESKFHRRAGASKAALLALVLHLQHAGGPRLLDVQWATPHLRSLGAEEVTRGRYHELLDQALVLPDAFGTTSGRDRSRPYESDAPRTVDSTEA
jgi:leucyl/phenylalanyl-tRNA--protein transferase